MSAESKNPSEERTWAVYQDPKFRLVDMIDEGPGATGPVGDHWRMGYTQEQARQELDALLNQEGDRRGCDNGPRSRF